MSRKITVLVESTQSKVVFESDATTLGELKRELRERQVGFNSDDVFKEGMTKTILASDDSVLPSNIPWKGQVTNDLVFMITAPQKKIRSGAMSRAEAYTELKRLGLQDKIQKEEGKNFTQCSTAILLSYIEEASKKAVKKEPKTKAKPADEAPIAKEKVVTNDAHTMPASGREAMTNLHKLLGEMVKEGVLRRSDADNIYGVANGEPAHPVEREKSYDELRKQFNF